MSQWVKALAAKPEDLSSIPRTHAVRTLTLTSSLGFYKYTWCPCTQMLNE